MLIETLVLLCSITHFINLHNQQWFGRRESSNVDDRRGFSGGGIAAGGEIVGIIIHLLYSFLSVNSVNPNAIPQVGGQDQQTSTPLSPEEQKADDTAPVL